MEEWWYQMQQPLPGMEKKKPTPAMQQDDGALFMAAMNTLGKG